MLKSHSADKRSIVTCYESCIPFTREWYSEFAFAQVESSVFDFLQHLDAGIVARLPSFDYSAYWIIRASEAYREHSNLTIYLLEHRRYLQ